MNNRVKELYDIEGQIHRRKKVRDLLIESTIRYFDQNGEWVGRMEEAPGLRERLWFSMAYLGSDDEHTIKLANNIIKSSKYSICHFSPMCALQLLLKFSRKLEDKSGDILKNYLNSVLDEFKGGDLDFVGVNDNFPCMGTFTVLLGGQLFNRPDLYETGIKRLNQFKSLLGRRGVDSEYTSPTYTPIHAYAMAEIANYTDNESLREIALQCEERVWVDLLGHYHTTTYQMAGPYSRAYTVDSAAHTHQARYILYALLGDKVSINPINTLFLSKERDKGEVIHLSLPFMQVSVTWLMGADYHCPEYLVEPMMNKKYPFLFKATTEYGPSTDVPQIDRPKTDLSETEEAYEYPAGIGSISTYMTEDYALGVASNEFHSGVQTDSFHLIYRRRENVSRQADIASVYSRYIINGKKPGQDNYYEEFDHSVSDALLMDEGRKSGIHNKNTAMMLYKPKAYGCKSVQSLKLSLVFPAQYGPVEEIRLGGVKLEGHEGSSVEPCTVFIKDGPVYMAFHPLALTDYGRKYAVKVEKANDYVIVSFYNYEGPDRDFPRRGFLLTSNGFVAEVGSQRESGSFEAFVDRMKGIKIRDELFTCMHWRWTYMRRVRYEREGLVLECEYSPVTEGIKYAAVNGKLVETPVLEVTGLDVSKVPFMNK